MKTSLKTCLLAATLVVMAACSAQKRAERRVRRAVAECPELVQMKAHPIEGTATAPAFADVAHVPLMPVIDGDTLYAATEHGTVAVSLRWSDSALRVGFVAAPRTIRYHDTLRLPQVALPQAQPQPDPKGSLWSRLTLWLCGVGAGMALGLWIVRKFLKKK